MFSTPKYGLALISKSIIKEIQQWRTFSINTINKINIKAFTLSNYIQLRKLITFLFLFLIIQANSKPLISNYKAITSLDSIFNFFKLYQTQPDKWIINFNTFKNINNHANSISI